MHITPIREAHMSSHTCPTVGHKVRNSPASSHAFRSSAVMHRCTVHYCRRSSSSSQGHALVPLCWYNTSASWNNPVSRLEQQIFLLGRIYLLAWKDGSSCLEQSILWSSEEWWWRTRRRRYWALDGLRKDDVRQSSLGATRLLDTRLWVDPLIYNSPPIICVFSSSFFSRS